VRFWLRFFFFSSRRRHTIFDCDWSSDVCSSDLNRQEAFAACPREYRGEFGGRVIDFRRVQAESRNRICMRQSLFERLHGIFSARSEEHTSELQSQSISYAVFCLKKKKTINHIHS